MIIQLWSERADGQSMNLKKKCPGMCKTLNSQLIYPIRKANISGKKLHQYSYDYNDTLQD